MPATTHAAPCAEEPCVVPLQQGDVAPWDGQLLSLERASQLLHASESCRERIAVESEIADIRVDQCQQELAAQEDVFAAQLATLQYGLSDADSAEWWEYPAPLWTIGAGFGSGLAVALLLGLIH